MQLNTKRILTVLVGLQAIDLAIGAGQLKITAHMIPEAFIPAVQDWAAFFAFVISIVVAGISGNAWATDPGAAPVKPGAAAAMVAALALGVLLLAGGSASAADLPVPRKAIRSALFDGYPYQGSGFYWGLNTLGGGGAVKAEGAGVNPNSVVSNEAGAGLTVGFSWANASGSVFYAVEAMFDVRNFNGNAAGFSFSGPASFEQRVKIGTPLSNFLSVFPGNFGLPAVPTMPNLPNGVVATNIHPYLMAGIHEDDVSVNYGLAGNRAWRIAPSVGVGAMGQLTQGVAIDVWVETVFPSNAICVGPAGFACGDIGQQVKAGIGLYY